MLRPMPRDPPVTMATLPDKDEKREIGSGIMSCGYAVDTYWEGEKIPACAKLLTYSLSFYISDALLSDDAGGQVHGGVMCMIIAEQYIH